MLKVGLLCGVIAALSATGVKSSLDVSKKESKPLDADFIIELDDEIENISAEKALKQQTAIVNKIKRQVNGNAVEGTHFTILNNAVVVSANKLDKQAIENLPGVKHVTENATHVVKKTEGSMISLNTSAYKRSEEPEIDQKANASAVTMNKPDGTNEGEGTLIAVLDNEFFLRGEYTDENGKHPRYAHEAFSALPAGTNTRLSYSDVASLINCPDDDYVDAVKTGKIHAYESKDLGAGVEGSLYFNSKVPFYFDYAGDSENGSSYGLKPDYNVESTTEYHGSHVASTAAGNAPEEGTPITYTDKDGNTINSVTTGYKGIAPLAQLALMKVFSDIKQTPIGQAAKMQDYSTFSEIGFISALEDCITLGVDAINVSIGSDLADFEQGSISQRTLQKISDAGILSSISGGNAGKASYAFTGGYANWTKDLVETGIMGSFANNASTMSIAAGQPVTTFYEDSFKVGDRVIPYNDQIVNKEGQGKTYNTEHRFVELINGGDGDPDTDPTEEQQSIEIDYVYLKGFGEEKDYKNYQDLSGKIAIVNRGKTNFSDKYDIAINNHSARGLIIINNDPTESSFTFTCDFGDAAKSIDKPVSIVLFKDKPFFEANPTGKFTIKKNIASVNPLAMTVSDFSTDGATYDLDLKPEITTPGSNIKGAVWPQNKKEKVSPLTAYEFMDGTSMAAPNYEGAMAVLLSKTTKDMDDFESKTALATLQKARKSVNMKFMSTATQMVDAEANDEDGKKSITSPRMQGAGMANIEAAYNTDVYLEGIDEKGAGINMSKIVLKNNDDIANGKVKLSFIAHNDSNKAHAFKVSYNVMRPAIALSNKVLTSDYGKAVTKDDVKTIPGFTFFSPEEEKIIQADGTANYKDVIKIEKDINYFENAEQYAGGEGEPLGVLKEGLYYNAAQNGEPIRWEPVPNYEYQSIKDVEIAKVDCGEITFGAKESKTIELNEYELTKEQKDRIQELYKSGTYIEGYVTLEAVEESVEDLSIPYMGFYSLTDRNEKASYSSAPVAEPFSFEKDPHTIYASDLIKDVAVSLLGKDEADMGSMILAGYAESPEDINIDKVVDNSLSFKSDPSFHEVGLKPDPSVESFTENPKQDIYVGNPNSTNTLIVQQFMLRSVKDNFVTITNKVTGEEVCRTNLTDMLFGTKELYKSHVDGSYLGGGYIAHRAYAIIPLYNPYTRQAFASGDYSLEFNYQIAGTGEWTKSSYTLHMDAEAPVVESIADFKDGDKNKVRIIYKDLRVAYAKVGSTLVDVKYNEEEGYFYSDVDKDIFDSAVSNSRKTSYSDSRVVITAVDYARGTTKAIVHFDGSDYSHFTIVQGETLDNMADFKFENGELKFIVLDDNFEEKEYNPTCAIKVINGHVDVTQKSNLGLVLGLSIGGGVLVLGGLGVLLFFLLKKKRLLGGK